MYIGVHRVVREDDSKEKKSAGKEKKGWQKGREDEGLALGKGG